MHALIVAGPSAAGKSSFVRELYAGRLAEDVRRYLPGDAASWPFVRCHRPEEWQQFASDGDIASRTAGIVVHHDITHHWRKHKQELARDPFWQILRQCEGVTLVIVRPSSRRLIDQWSRARAGMPPWKLRARKLLAASASHLLANLWRLRRPHPRISGRTRYPRSVRFLKYVDRKLRSYRMPSTWHFDLYRRPRDVERMLDAWNDMIAAKTAALPVTRIEVMPASDSKIGKTLGWSMKSLESIKRPSAAAGKPSPA